MTTAVHETRCANITDAINANARTGWCVPAQQVAYAALAAGPATTTEIRRAAGQVIREVGEFYRWTGDLYRALRQLEAAGHATGIRLDACRSVLWALTPGAAGLGWGTS
jgi:hypothetical protein